jgi:hypothetical protein
MRYFSITIAVLLLYGCDKNETYIPPPPSYFLLLPQSKSTWSDHIEKGFLAGCEQLQMECKAQRYGKNDAESISQAVLDMGDPKDAPVCIAFDEQDAIKKTMDLLSLKGRTAITVGVDDSNAFRAGHVGADVKKLATQIANRSQALSPEANRILFTFGSSPIDQKMLEASVFRESDRWQKYRPRNKSLADVTAEDYTWCDLVVPVGEDALKKAVESSASRIIPTDPTDGALALLKSGRSPIVVANNYFDIGVRASRIAREHFVYGRISKAILPIPPKEIDVSSLPNYLENRFKPPALTPSVKPKKSAPK